MCYNVLTPEKSRDRFNQKHISLWHYKLMITLRFLRQPLPSPFHTCTTFTKASPPVHAIVSYPTLHHLELHSARAGSVNPLSGLTACPRQLPSAQVECMHMPRSAATMAFVESLEWNIGRSIAGLHGLLPAEIVITLHCGRAGFLYGVVYCRRLES